jgi:hypothetical protein
MPMTFADDATIRVEVRMRHERRGKSSNGEQVQHKAVVCGVGEGDLLTMFLVVFLLYEMRLRLFDDKQQRLIW